MPTIRENLVKINLAHPKTIGFQVGFKNKQKITKTLADPAYLIGKAGWVTSKLKIYFLYVVSRNLHSALVPSDQ